MVAGSWLALFIEGGVRLRGDVALRRVWCVATRRCGGGVAVPGQGTG